MEETTITDRTEVRIELQVFIEDETKAVDTLRQADRRSCDINRDDIAERFVSVDRDEDC